MNVHRILLMGSFIAFVWSDRWDNLTENDRKDCFVGVPELTTTTERISTTIGKISSTISSTLTATSATTAPPALIATSSSVTTTSSSIATTTSSTTPPTSTPTTTTINSSPTSFITTSTTASTAKTSTTSTKPSTPHYTTTTATLSILSTTTKTPTTAPTATTTTIRTTASTSSSISTTVTTTSTIPSDTPTTSMTTIPTTSYTTSTTDAPNTVTNTSTTTSSKTTTATSSSVTTQKTVPTTSTTSSRTTPSARNRNTLPASSTTQSTETTKRATSSTTKMSTALSKTTSLSTITSYSTKTRTTPTITSDAIATTSTSSQQTPRSARMTTLLTTTTTATTHSTMPTSKPTIEATSSKTTASTGTDHITTKDDQTFKTLGKVSSVRSSASTSTTPVTTTSPIKIPVTSAPAISTGLSGTYARSSAVSVTTESFTTNPTTSTPAAELGSPSSSAQTTTVTASTASAESASTEKLTSGTFGADTTMVVTESTSSMTTDYGTVTGGTEARHVPTSGSDTTISTSSEHSTTVHHTQPIAITKTAEAADETTVKSDQEDNVIESTTAQSGTSTDDQRTDSSAPPSPSSGISSESDAPTTSSTSSTTTTTVNKQPETTKTLSSVLGLRTTGHTSSKEATVRENVVNTETTERTTTTETESSTTETDSATVPTTPAEDTTTMSESMITDVKTIDPTSTSTKSDEVRTTTNEGNWSSVSSTIKDNVSTTIQDRQPTEHAAFSTYDTTAVEKTESTVTVSSASINGKTTIMDTVAGSEETDRLTSTGIPSNGQDNSTTNTVTSALIDGSSTGAKSSTTTTQMKEAVETGKVSTEKKTVTSAETTTGTGEMNSMTTPTEQHETTEVIHFHDLNIDAPETAERAHCQDVCPPGFNESHTFCYLLAPQEKSLTYAAAISYCQSLSSPQSNLAVASDFQDEQTRQLIQELRMEDNRPIDAFVVNAQGSASFRKHRQIDLISLSLVTRFHVNPFLSVEVGSELEGVNAICRAPKFCRPNTCPLELFYEHSKQLVVGLPPERSELLEGEELIAPCIQFRTGQEHRIRCLPNGQFSVHPSLVTCRKPEDAKEEEIDTPLNPLHPKTCQDCYDIGTEKCTKNRNGPGVLCHCKAGWSQRTCWMSPVLCNERSCGEHGQCVSYVDYTECLCEKGWIGDRCTVNASRATWMGSNDSLAVFDLRSAGLATQSVTSMMILLLKFVSKVFTEQDCIDPQDTFQDFRRVTMCVAGFLGIFFTHPDIFGLDPIGCRFHYVMISVCYTFGLVFWAGEGLNIMYVCRGINKNLWSVDFDGNKRKFLRYAYRVTLPALLSMMMVIGIIGHSWTLVGNSFNCFGSFAQANGKTWSPLLALNCCWLLVAYAGCEGAGLLLRNRPHCYIRLIHWFNLYQPRNLEQVNKVHRNRLFVSVGATLHLLSWIVLSIASDTNTSVMDTISFALSVMYSGWCLLQFLITDESAYGKFSMIMMCILPKKLSPTFDWRFLRNRDETLAANFNWRYKREQNALIREEDKRIEKERLDIEEKNRKLREKFPNIPSRLLYHCPLEGPAVSHPRSFPFDPSRDEFMTAYERECLVKIWTQSYLDTRAFLKRTPEQCGYEVVKKELQRHCLQQKTTERKQQELYLLGQWWMSVPGRDSVKLRAHENRVVMVDPEETPLLAFERAVSKLTSIIDLRENRKRKRLLVDEEIIPFSNASQFIRFLPSLRIQFCKCRVLDQWGDPEEKKFIKMPDIVLQEQIEIVEKEYRKTIDEDNISFNKIYSDDIMYTQWIGSEHESAAKEILGVVPAQIGEQPISMNPRRRPLDQHWLDTAKPDFIGPRQERDAIPLGPYGHYARSCVYFQAQLDAQWEKYRRNAAIVRAEEKIRKGEL